MRQLRLLVCIVGFFLSANLAFAQLNEPVRQGFIPSLQSQVLLSNPCISSDANLNKPAKIQQETEQSLRPKPTLRVLTYNIHHGRAMDGKFDYERLAETIRKLNPDVVALQEVDNKTGRASGIDQAKKLGEMLEMNSVFGNALYFSGGQYGEAILSRFAIKKADAHHLPFRFGNEPRVALAATISPDNGLPEFVIVGTHLCHQSAETRLEQTRELDRIFSSTSGPPVIMAGDFNARPGSDAMKVLLDNVWSDAVAPNSKIDYILTRNQDSWKVVETKIIDEPVVSDHDPILTILEWDGK